MYQCKNISKPRKNVLHVICPSKHYDHYEYAQANTHIKNIEKMVRKTSYNK